MARDDLQSAFRERFGARPSRRYFSPGRLNLIGEYTDFNGGCVLPAALDLGTWFAVRENRRDGIRIFSEAFGAEETIPFPGLSERRAGGGWLDYVTGTLIGFSRRGITGPGLDLYVTGDLPRNSGLSSSASLTVGVAYLLNDMWGAGLDRLALVHIAREVENAFVGVQCGIMDQFAVALGARGQGIHLDCDSLDYELLPLEMDGYEIVITDSRVPRKLAESAYNERRNECRLALEALRQVRPFECLCAATVADVDASAALRALPVVYRRARHVVAENERVALAADALRRGELERFGRLLYASHESLRDDFEVSCRELDLLVETAMSVPGVLGARMTGAGFGGCMFALVAAGSVSAYVSAMHAAYSSQTPYEARMIRCGIGDGVKRLDGTGSGSDSDATAR